MQRHVIAASSLPSHPPGHVVRFGSVRTVCRRANPVTTRRTHCSVRVGLRDPDRTSQPTAARSAVRATAADVGDRRFGSRRVIDGSVCTMRGLPAAAGAEHRRRRPSDADGFNSSIARTRRGDRKGARRACARCIVCSRTGGTVLPRRAARSSNFRGGGRVGPADFGFHLPPRPNVRCDRRLPSSRSARGGLGSGSLLLAVSLITSRR